MQNLQAGTGNICCRNPVLVHVSLPEGPDGIYGTSNDGLRLSKRSTVISTGTTKVTFRAKCFELKSGFHANNGPAFLAETGWYN